MRKDAREIVFKVLFSELFNDDVPENLFNELINEEKLNDKDIAFAKTLLQTVILHKDELIATISELANNYDVSRIYSTDRCALMLGLCEMKYFDDVPNIVAIDEALNLARNYSTEKSLSFLNGIFAEYKKRLENKE